MTKYQHITGVYESTIGQVTATPAAWTAFLRSACRNYKCRFDEQILIYVQRPDSIAALETKRWNKLFGRWVNRGATGIAVFNDEHNGEYKLKHYFDISDTHASRFARPVPLWDMRPEYEAEVIETLANAFGELDDKSTLADAIVSAARNAVADNMVDYLADFKDCLDGSALQDYPDDYLTSVYRYNLYCSVAYMMLTRCGIDADSYLSDFRQVTDFDTRNTVNALGIAASDITEMCIREIASTVLNIQNREQEQNRTFAIPEKPAHTVNVTQNIERGATHDRSLNVSDGERLQNPESDRAGGRAGSPWQIRITPKEISQESPARPVSELPDGGNAQPAFDGDRADGTGAHGTDNLTDGGDAGRDGGTESVRSDEMGRDDEQHPAISGGNNQSGTDLRIKPLPTEDEQAATLGEAEEQSSAFSMDGVIPQEIIDTQLIREGGGNGVVQLRFRIYHGLQELAAEGDAANIIKSEIGMGSGNAVSDASYFVLRDDNGLTFTKLHGLNQGATYTLSWEKAAKRVRELIAADRYLTPMDKETHYPQYLSHIEQQKPQPEKDRHDETAAQLPAPADTAEYAYHAGDKVYIGAQEYEVLAMDDHFVKLYDTAFPMINKEIPRDSFDRIIAENPMNDHLRKPELIADKLFEETTETGFKTDYYLFNYQKETDEPAALSHESLALIKEKADIYVFCAEVCYLSEEEQARFNVAFRKMPRDWFLLPREAQDQIRSLKPEYEQQWRSDFLGLYKNIFVGAALLDQPYTDARANSDEENSRIECEAAVTRIAHNIGLDDLDFYRAYHDEPGIKEELIAHVFQETYHAPAPEQSVTAETPRIFYRKYLALFIEEVKSSNLYGYLRDRETDALSAERAISDELDALAGNYRETDPAFFEVYNTSSQFREWLIEDILEVTYQDYSPGIRDSVAQRENDPDCPGWAKRPALEEQIREDLYQRGYAVSDELIEVGIEEYRARGGMGGNAGDIADYIEDELLSEDKPAPDVEPEPEAPSAEPEPYTPKPGERYEIQGRLFELDSINEEWGKVSLRDITFQNGAGFPIFREESLDFIRQYDPITIFRAVADHETNPQLESNQEIREIGKSRYIIVLPEPERTEPPLADNQHIEKIGGVEFIVTTPFSKQKKPRKTESGVNYPGEIVIKKVPATLEQIEAALDYKIELMLLHPEYPAIKEAAEYWKTWRTMKHRVGIAADHLVERIIKMDDAQAAKWLSSVPWDNWREALDIGDFEPLSVKIRRMDAQEALDAEDEPTITPAWEQKKRPVRVNYFDAFPDVPMSERHNFKITDDDLGHGGAKAKFRANMDAIHLLHELEFDGKLATPEQQEILSRYVGWGSLQQAFQERQDGWGNEFAELYAALSPEEYAAARATTLNAHYTSPTVIKAIYKAVENMGFQTGNILDPGCGTGNFQGLCPTAWPTASYTALR